MTGTLVLPTSGPLTAAVFAGNANTALAALSNMLQSATAPTTSGTGLASLAGVWWHDTANKLIKVRNQADSAWITVLALDETNNVAGLLNALTTQTFTGTGGNTWTKPPWGTWALVEAWGAGGSGARNSTATSAGGGAGGEYAAVLIRMSLLSATETMTVGTGGASRTGSNQTGQDGGNSTFTVGGVVNVTAGGGAGGSASNAFSTTSTLGSSVYPFRVSTGGTGSASGAGGQGYAGGGGGSANGSAAGGTSYWAAAGNGGAGGATGTNGSSPGGGGGGGTSTSGAGGNGQGRVTVF